VAFGEDPKNAILLSGYQAGGTRGRSLAEGAETLRIFGRDVPIRAEVVQLESMSAHADAQQIVEWMRTAPTPPTQVYITHGEPASSDALRFRIQDQLRWPVRVPRPGETVSVVR
jgi:metallo-beta-lactamase family protein